MNGRIRLSVSTVNRTYELSGITHVTLFPKYGKHSTGPSTYGPWVRTYSKSFSCKPVLTVCSYRAQSNEIFTYGEVSRGSVPRVRRYGLLYLRAVEYDQWHFLHLLRSCLESGVKTSTWCMNRVVVLFSFSYFYHLYLFFISPHTRGEWRLKRLDTQHSVNLFHLVHYPWPYTENPNLSSLEAVDVVMTIYGTAFDDKVGIITTLNFQCKPCRLTMKF